MTPLRIPKEGLDLLCPVGQEAIPDQNQRTFLKLAEEVFQEIANDWGIDIGIGMKTEIKADEIPLR